MEAAEEEVEEEEEEEEACKVCGVEAELQQQASSNTANLSSSLPLLFLSVLVLVK